MQGWSTKGRGVAGITETGHGVSGESKAGGGVVGVSDTGNGGWFESNHGEGVRGWSRNPNHGGVVGVNTGGGNGGYFESNTHEAIHAVTNSTTTAAVAAYQANPASGTAALYAKTAGTGLAGHFDGAVFIARDASIHGNVSVDGDLVLTGADVAEQFELSTADLEPGSVVVLDDDGRLTASSKEYDPRVAGIISGAGDRVPALVLDRVPTGGAVAPGRGRRPVAVVGKAWCRADASAGPIHVGDLLTTSTVAGHAMRAHDRLTAIGAVIGKALTPLPAGTGHVLVLVGLG
jgi:hypothetical protein